MFFFLQELDDKQYANIYIPVTKYEKLFGKLQSMLIVFKLILKVKTSIGNAPISKNEMEALITNHVKEYVLINT